MSKDRHSRHYNNWKNNRRDKDRDRDRDYRYNDSNRNSNKHTSQISVEQIRKEDEAIKAFKNSLHVNCEKCGQVIYDIASAFSGKAEGSYVHFDCALDELRKQEKLEDGDKLTYIGQGRFGIVNFPNVHDTKHFTIKKIIDVEDKESKLEWRTQMADLYSQVR